MRNLHDALGVELSTASPEAVLAWNRMTEEVLSHGRNAAAALSDVVAADPSLAVAHAIRGLMLMGLARAELVDEAESALAAARRLSSSSAVTPRETSFADALEHWLAGQPLQAAGVLDDSLRRYPRDILAFKFAHAIRFVAGDLAGMREAARRSAHRFAGTAHHGFALGCQAFAEEEAGDMTAAERLARQAISLSPRDAWGRHALAHVLEMTGRAREGSQWLGATAQNWAHCNNFSYHMYWHLALFELELGRTGAALDLYDREIRADRTDDYRDLANGASLLARLEIEGVHVGRRWEEMAEIASRRVSDRRLVFADLHYVLALTGAGRDDEAMSLIGSLRDDARSGRGHDGYVARKVGFAAAAGLAAFRAGDFTRAARLFDQVLPELTAVGGSHAQRDLFEQLAIESMTRSGDTTRAVMHLERRLAQRGGRNLFAVRRLASIGAAARGGGEKGLGLRLASLAIATTAPALAH
jgi:tetratricopeptide (TPR) repeat protein